MAIQPEDMQAHLARQAAGGAPIESAAEAAPTRPAALPPLAADSLEALLASIAASYFSLRIGLALLAFAFPLLLIALAGGNLIDSISAYYHQPPGGDGGLIWRQPRDVFVGILCAIGAFLWLYKGYRTRENVALNLAGLAAIGIALFPTDLGDEITTATGLVHGICAVTYFLAIAFVCLFEAKATLPLLHDEAKQRLYAMAYRLLGVLMVGLPLLVVALHWVPRAAEEGGAVFWLEFVAIYVFAAYWIVKSIEIRAIKNQPPVSAG